MKCKFIKFMCSSVIIFFVMVLVVVGGIMWFISQDEHTSVNDCIRQTHQSLDEIRELVCTPPTTSVYILYLRDRWGDYDYDLLGQLQNLESITVKRIGSGDEQVIFQELTKLKKLSSVTLSDIPGCSIKRLGDIESLSSLCIENARYPITDLELLGTYGSFQNLRSLTLDDVHMETLPDLSRLQELESLAVHDFGLTRLEPGSVNWENLVSLDISYTHISSLDGEIVGRLCNLTTLDLSRGRVTDVSFVLDLPKLKSFSYRGHISHGVDLERLREHPNFNEDWLKD